METNKILELGRKYGTDKVDHGYLPFYASTLPENPRSILEIGVKQGASIRMWRELFPNALICGLDLFEEFPIPTDIPNTYFVKGNQIDDGVLQGLRVMDFDVIIDDGSHNSRDQLITFFSLFNGKHYYIEDLHCCRDPFYRQGLPYHYTADKIFHWFPYPQIKFAENITLITDVD